MNSFKPGVTAIQVRLHPVLVSHGTFVWKNISTVLVLVAMVDGKEEPQLLSIKVVPSPSVILT